MTRRTLAATGTVVALVVGLSACAAEPSDFSDEAEKFIQTDEVTDWADGVSFSEPACEDPVDTDTDTTFQCTALGSDQHSYVFQVVITGRRQFRIDTVQPRS